MLFRSVDNRQYGYAITRPGNKSSSTPSRSTTAHASTTTHASSTPATVSTPTVSAPATTSMDMLVMVLCRHLSVFVVRKRDCAPTVVQQIIGWMTAPKNLPRPRLRTLQRQQLRSRPFNRHRLVASLTPSLSNWKKTQPRQ